MCTCIISALFTKYIFISKFRICHFFEMIFTGNFVTFCLSGSNELFSFYYHIHLPFHSFIFYFSTCLFPRGSFYENYDVTLRSTDESGKEIFSMFSMFLSFINHLFTTRDGWWGIRRRLPSSTLPSRSELPLVHRIMHGNWSLRVARYIQG